MPSEQNVDLVRLALTVRDGRIAAFRDCRDWSEALAVAGIG
jgi:hypothetical protein